MVWTTTKPTLNPCNRQMFEPTNGFQQEGFQITGPITMDRHINAKTPSSVNDTSDDELNMFLFFGISWHDMIWYDMVYKIYIL